MSTSQEVTERMSSQIARWETAGDRRAIFLNCYWMMTANMLAAIQSGEFHDGVWVNALLNRFAEYYFDGLEAYEHTAPDCPAVWAIAHDAARQPQTQVLQNLLLGINAHVNYDLVLSLVDILLPEWERLSGGQRNERYADHCQVNAVIARTVDAVQDNVVERWTPAMDVVDKLLGPLDEWMIGGLIRRWRGQVWEDAVVWLEAPAEANRRQIRQQVTDGAVRKAHAILQGPAAVGQIL